MFTKTKKRSIINIAATLFLAAAVLAVVLAAIYINSKSNSSGEAASPSSDNAPVPMPAQTEDKTVPLFEPVINSYNDCVKRKPLENDPLWNLILLNMSNAISEEIPFEKSEFDTQYIDKRIENAYRDMIKGAKAEGVTLFLRSGYRSIATQDNNYHNALTGYAEMGYSEDEALALTEQYYTRAGHSEHHSGLALDIITPEYHNGIRSLDERFADTGAYKWLSQNCVKYGFILRYPKEKQELTKINFEPWHYRYVGLEHAKAIEKSGLCLEEYLQGFWKAFEEKYGMLENSESISEDLAVFAKEYPGTVLR